MLILLALALAVVADQAPRALGATPVNPAADAQAILAASDAIRNPSQPFGLTLDLIEYRDGKQTDAATLRVYSKAEGGTGRFRTLVRYDTPARDAGKLILQNGLDLWFYDPSSQASVRISPQQRLLGQASNGDVVTVNFAHDYRAELAAEEDIQDGEHVSRHCYELSLNAVVADVTYHRIEMWIEQQSRRPVKGKFYAESGRLLKTAYYRRFQPELGAERPTEVVIIDGLTPSWVTVMRYSDYAWREIPESWLQRDYLARFKPE
jgi:outer membrane lipoprotein-sorting protein